MRLEDILYTHCNFWSNNIVQQCSLHQTNESTILPMHLARFCWCFLERRVRWPIVSFALPSAVSVRFKFQFQLIKKPKKQKGKISYKKSSEENSSVVFWCLGTSLESHVCASSTRSQNSNCFDVHRGAIFFTKPWIALLTLRLCVTSMELERS